MWILLINNSYIDSQWFWAVRIMEISTFKTKSNRSFSLWLRCLGFQPTHIEKICKYLIYINTKVISCTCWHIIDLPLQCLCYVDTIGLHFFGIASYRTLLLYVLKWWSLPLHSFRCLFLNMHNLYLFVF